MTSNAPKFHESIPATRRGKRVVSVTDAMMVSEWMNAAQGRTAAHKRVSALFAHLERLDAILSGQAQGHTPNEWFGHQSAANGLLERYAFVPRLACGPQVVRRYYAAPRREAKPAVKISDGSQTVTVSEVTAANALARLFAAHSLFHIHRCASCNKWHARTRRMDRFCGRDCQLNHYRSSAEAKERNRLAQGRHREQYRRGK